MKHCFRYVRSRLLSFHMDVTKYLTGATSGQKHFSELTHGLGDIDCLDGEKILAGTCVVQEACGVVSSALHRSGSRGQLTRHLSGLPPAARPYFLKVLPPPNMVPPTGNQIFMWAHVGSFTVKPQQTSILIWRLQRQQVDICWNLELVGEHWARDNNLGNEETFKFSEPGLSAMKLVEKNQGSR